MRSSLASLSRYGGRVGGVRGVLVAPSITESALKLLKELGLEYVKIEKKAPNIVRNHIFENVRG
jgi:RecB family endonuclease NucS